MFKKFLSFVLIICLFLGSLSSSFGNYEKNISKTEIEGLQKDYYIRSELETPYGKAYFVADKKTSSQYEDRLFWDLVDIAMAGWSWAKMFNDPSWENFGTAVIDTAGLLPLVPSLSTVRNSDEAIKVIANAYKKDKRVRDKINATKKVISKIKYIPQVTGITNGQLHKKIKHAFEMKIIDRSLRDKKGKIIADRVYHNIDGVAKDVQEKIFADYRKKILDIVKKSKEYYEGSLGQTPAIVHVDRVNRELVFTKMSGEFLSAFRVKNDKMLQDKLKNYLKIKIN